MKKVFILIILASLIIGNAASAEEKLSLNDALKYALENNNELLAMQNSLSATERDIGIARSSLMPKMKFEESFVSTNNPALAFGLKLNQRRFTAADLAGAPGTFNEPGTINNFLTGVYLEQPIYMKKANIMIEMAKKDYSAKGYEYLRKREEIAFQVSQAYLMVSTAQEYVQVAQKALDEANENLRIAQIRYKNELGLYSDLLRAKTSVIEAEQKLVSANKNVNVSKRALGLMLGNNAQAEISGGMPFLTLKDYEMYKTVAMFRNDIKAMEVNVDNAKNNIKFAEADYYPTFGVGGGYQLYDHQAPFAAEGHNYTASGFMKWDVFDGKKTKYEKLKAKDKVGEVQQYLEGMKKEVSYRVYESYQNIEESSKNLELAQASLCSAEEGQKLVQKRWQNSLSPIVDLLDAQTNLVNARANVIKSRNGYKSALLNLSYQSGILFEDLDVK